MVKGNPLYKEAQEVFESLSIENHDLSIENIRINKKPENDRIIFVGAANKNIPAETWRLIDKALMENRVITFDYQSLTDSKPSPRRVQPWQLIYDNGNWNLHALDVIKNGRRRYSLGEIAVEPAELERRDADLLAVIFGPDSARQEPPLGREPDYCSRLRKSRFRRRRNHFKFQKQPAFLYPTVGLAMGGRGISPRAKRTC